jgi:hypothetical protein
MNYLLKRYEFGLQRGEKALASPPFDILAKSAENKNRGPSRPLFDRECQF